MSTPNEHASAETVQQVLALLDDAYSACRANHPTPVYASAKAQRWIHEARTILEDYT